ncbi:MAG: hypothetical protein QM681_25595 [Novosphingobium sp.]
MRLAFLIPALLPLAGCIIGDPRTTEIENKSAHIIVVSFTDGAFDMSRRIEIQPNSVGNLAPNYQFSDLKYLKIIDGGHSYDMQALSSRLSKICSEYCTLSYEGNGRLTTREWKYQPPR